MAEISPNARVNAAQVREIFDTELSDAQLNAFINTANIYTTSLLGNSGLSGQMLTEIEKYLSAHFASMRDPRFETEKVGQYSYRVQGKTDMGLDATFYGQQAKLLDTSGRLSAADTVRKIATIEVLTDD